MIFYLLIVYLFYTNPKTKENGMHVIFYHNISIMQIHTNKIHILLHLLHLRNLPNMDFY